MNARIEGRPNTRIPFTKASACGNDFLIADGAHASGDLFVLTRRLCDRHRGVGADGVEWLFPDAEADVSAQLINADGSEAEVSGNGTRCVAAKVCAQEGKTEIVVRTGAGLKTCRLISPPDGRQASTFEFETDMGQPELSGELTIAADGVPTVGTRVSMGNPHYVIFVDNFPEVLAAPGGADRAAAPISPGHECGVCSGATARMKSKYACLSGAWERPSLQERDRARRR